MARPPKYASEEEKPVSVTLRLPRTLYDQAQQHARRRQTTLTELVREGLQMRLETPTDPRDVLATQEITVMQELRQMIAEEVQAALAAQTPEAPAPRQRADTSKTQHYSNATQEQPSGPEPAHSLDTEPTHPPKGGRPSSPERQQILALLAEHPEGLSAEQIRVYITATKPLGDMLQGMKRNNVLTAQGQGKTLRYFAAQ